MQKNFSDQAKNLFELCEKLKEESSAQGSNSSETQEKQMTICETVSTCITFDSPGNLSLIYCPAYRYSVEVSSG